METNDINGLIDRLARLAASGEWATDLNPAQATAFRYLARANRFSRSPSHVAEYLNTTRGTASQTLKALARKGLVRESAGIADRRSISYTLTEAGTARLRELEVGLAPEVLDAKQQKRLTKGLEALLASEVARRGGKSFGLCATCRHHKFKNNQAFCALLDVALEPSEADQICHEHTGAGP